MEEKKGEAPYAAIPSARSPSQFAAPPLCSSLRELPLEHIIVFFRKSFDRLGMGKEAVLVNLNIGGTSYTTTKETLLREPDTLFSEIFLCENEERRELSSYVLRLEDGSYFIDRDGPLFAHILAFLRTSRLVLPDGFRETARLRDEVDFYRVARMQQELTPLYNLRYPGSPRPTNGSPTGTPTSETGGGYITLGYRGTFAFGRDGQADVKFRKLHRILVCGKVALCREVFGDTLNESRDPGDMDGVERYTSRLYLKHQCLEKACDNMAEKGFKLVATCCSGANGLATPSHPVVTGQLSNSSQNELMNHRNSGDYEEQRWAHYTEYVFYREAQALATSSSPTRELTATI